MCLIRCIMFVFIINIILGGMIVVILYDEVIRVRILKLEKLRLKELVECLGFDSLFLLIRSLLMVM